MGARHSSHFSFGGRPRRRGAGDFSFIPRALSASRNRHSTCALTLLRSAAAQRSTAAHKARSTRNGYALRSPPSGMTLGVERAGVEDRLRVALAAKHDHQVGNHRRSSFVVELDNPFLG
jgi:hypothetical protein